ncbi:large ribosomal subunit protein mL54 [Anabrus simplex]|uniref:large ribosomal subunit protein mL54 n=1 Tax=Anabrus simplex TaxID=316456 RepID=UPI0034DD943F
MNIPGKYSLLRYFKQIQVRWQVPSNSYAKKSDTVGSLVGKRKKVGKLGPVMEKKVLPVEKDPNILVNFVCGSNLNKEGQDIQLKSDNEYPDWLWTLRTGKAPPLSEMDPNTLEYWKRVRKMGLRRNNLLAKLKKF